MKDEECPHCGYKIDAHTSVIGEYTPKKDDISVCLNCAGWLKFDENLTLLKFTEEDQSNCDQEVLDQLREISVIILNTPKNEKRT